MSSEKKFVVETSARHVHVTEETFKVLFGEDAKMEVKKMLSQPGQYASTSRVDVVGPKNTIKNVSILGPARKANQVEMSLTDCRTLGVDAPIRESGDIKGSAPIKIVGPKGEVELTEGLIVAKRHIHMTEEDAAEYGVKNGEIVSVKIESPRERTAILGDVVVRVSPKFALAMHIDTDESNALGLQGNAEGTIVKS